MLSFKESHMAERLSLLTMIIIGEGVIGSTKTAGALWPTTSNPTVGGVIAMISIIVMLVSPSPHYLDIKVC
jgi:low temperature requirement protein LtrA